MHRHNSTSMIVPGGNYAEAGTGWQEQLEVRSLRVINEPAQSNQLTGVRARVEWGVDGMPAVTPSTKDAR
jgi:hypothetical protein